MADNTDRMTYADTPEVSWLGSRGWEGHESLCWGFRYAPCSLAGLLMLVVLLSGCTHFKEYIHNGFKVGPNYCRPPAPAAENWIDAADVRIRNENDDLTRWWAVFDDPELNALVREAYLQNLTLRQAGCRVLQAHRRASHRRRQLLSANATGNRQLPALRGQHGGSQPHERPLAVLLAVDLRVHPRLGARLLGPVPPCR